MPDDMSKLDGEGLWEDDPGKMTLISGKRVNPIKITPADVVVSDIARALSRQCRYNGHVTGYLSVARHSLWVSERIYNLGYLAKTAMAGLLHDAAEAYLGDMIRPLKRGELGEGYLTAERHVETAIAQKLQLDYPFHAAVHEADNFVLMELELPPEGARYTWKSTPDEDEGAFLARYFYLRDRIKIEDPTR